MNASLDTQQIEAAIGSATPPAPPRRKLSPGRRALLVTAVALGVAAAGAAYIAAPASHESTNDAYVGADATAVAPRVRGLVAEVLVRDNQTVRAGDPLVRIDAEEFDARVATARADLASVEAGVGTAKAALTSLDAEERLAAAEVAAAKTSIAAANAEATRAKADRARFESLALRGAGARRDAETAKAAAITADQDVARVTALLDVATQKAAVTAAKRATLTAALTSAEAMVARAKAALDLALQDQRHATILAPIDGVVGNRQVQQGDYVQPGSRLLTLVPLHDLYVTAYFKETQTGRMKAGQPVAIEIDALPGEEFTGTVESLAPGSGSEFALLPFEPGTGNFTKVVQRVGVRIHFDAGQPALAHLRPGLSVTANVKLTD